MHRRLRRRHEQGRPAIALAYDSERNQELRAVGRQPVYRIVRPRTLLYAAVLVLVVAVMLAGLGLRSTVDVNILPERNPLFVRLADGSIRNGYTLRVMNKERSEKAFQLGVTSADALLNLPGQAAHASTVTLLAPPDGVASHRVYVQLPPAQVPDEVNDITFVLTDTTTGAANEFASVFRGPKR
jgi:polyferredoxin